jgi:hypothetical protein
MQTLETLVKKALDNSKNGVSFFSIKGYTNDKGEVSNRVINIGVSYQNAKKKDIEFLTNLDVKTLKSDLGVQLLEEARQSLLGALISPNKTRSEGQINAFTNISDAVKIHNETKALYIFGFEVKDKNGISKKTIIEKGEYKEDTRKPITKAKDFIRTFLKSSQYRQFKVEQQPKEVAYSGANETIIVELV